MTKASALYNFFSSFGINAYEETLVPTKEAPKLPYLTYQLITDSFDNEVLIPVSLWYRFLHPHQRMNSVAALHTSGFLCQGSRPSYRLGYSS